ncbi:MAG TPA: M48 family peptidase, partial [Candidatus Binatia bacterium]|nr:M48 family peptidase [Candidatus Binatia bacterium]
MEHRIVALFLLLFAVEFLVEFVLNELNLRYVRACWARKQIPDFFCHKLSGETYENSVRYTLAKGQFQRWSEIYSRFWTLVILFSGVLGWLDDFSGRLAEPF